MKESNKTQIINISHNFTDREYSKKNLEKYFVFSHVIEYLALLEGATILSDCSIESLQKIVAKCSRGKYKDPEWIGRWIAELKFMGIVKCRDGDGVRFQLTDAGKDMYRQQTFQSIYSDLLDAKESRNLTIMAIVVSVIALVISVCSLLFGC